MRSFRMKAIAALAGLAPSSSALGRASFGVSSKSSSTRVTSFAVVSAQYRPGLSESVLTLHTECVGSTQLAATSRPAPGGVEWKTRGQVTAAIQASAAAASRSAPSAPRSIGFTGSAPGRS